MDAPKGISLQSRLLTRQERTILQLVANGLDSKDIGQRLEVSMHTVHAHVRNLTRKLNATSRSHAVALGLRMGWIN